MQGQQRPSEQECLRLMRAFFRVHDLGQRRGLIALAEWFAAVPKPKPFEKLSPILQDNRRPCRRRT